MVAHNIDSKHPVSDKTGQDNTMAIFTFFAGLLAVALVALIVAQLFMPKSTDETAPNATTSSMSAAPSPGTGDANTAAAPVNGNVSQNSSAAPDTATTAAPSTASDTTPGSSGSVTATTPPASSNTEKTQQ